MKVIPILPVTGAMLSGFSVPEPDASQGEIEWTSAPAFAIGDKRVRSSIHRKYLCVKAVPAGTVTAPELDTLSWLDVGATNRWAMFNQSRNFQTVQTSGNLTVTLTPGQRVSSVFLGGLEAKTVILEMVAAGVTVYSETFSGQLRGTSSWHDYFFGSFKFRPSLLITNLPAYATAEIKLTLVNPGLGAKCSTFAVGNAVFIGKMQYGATSDALNFSKIDRDTFGNAVLIPRRTVPTITGTLEVAKNLVDTVREVRVKLNAVPAVWSALDDPTEDYFGSLLVVGIYKQFSITIDNFDTAKINLQVEEI